jgi:hypothetical protein
MGIHYSAGASIHFQGCLASDLNEHQSTFKYMFTLGSKPVCWCYRKQDIVGLFFTKTEYASVVHEGKHLP